jgi:hypothetical protein
MFGFRAIGFGAAGVTSGVPALMSSVRIPARFGRLDIGFILSEVGIGRPATGGDSQRAR